VRSSVLERQTGFWNDEAAMERSTPVFIVCSPLPHVGKTFVARLLAEFFRADGRDVIAFDVNPDDYALSAQLPELASIADIGDTRGQVALFDQLIVSDEVIKIIDLGYASFEKFFNVMRDIEFAPEARLQAIAPTVLFIADSDQHSNQAYVMLRERFPETAIVPVINSLNNGASAATRPRDKFWPKFAMLPLQISYLPPTLHGMFQRSGTMSTDERDPAYRELLNWMRRTFLQFRELEVRLLLERLKPALKLRA
jgi:hypothetical protein